MTTPRDLTADLGRAVDGLIKPRRTRLLRDAGGKVWTDWADIPSLWDQLQGAVAVGTERREGGGSRYKTPLDIDAMELRHTILELVADALTGHDKPTTGTLPEQVRRLAATIREIPDDDLTDWWTRQFGSFNRWISTALHLHNEPQPRRIRDTACPNCQATHVTVPGPDGPERVPALLIDFVTGADGRSRVRAATCSICLATWWRGQDLLDLAERLNPQSDTRGSGVVA